MPELSEDVVKAYDEFRSSELEQFHVWIRTQRAEQLRELLAQPSRLDLETFNHEVWALETATYLRGAKLAPGELGGKSFDSAWIADVRQAFADGELELHGNYMWGSGSKVFGAPLQQDNQEKLELVREALEILNGDASPLEKAERIIAIPGFGPNIATGLVMTYHPDQFQISNQVSKAVVAKLGFANTPLWAFEESVSAIRTALGAEDFLELDSFMYRQQQNGPVISLKDLTSAAAVTSALDEFDELGREPFLMKYGFAKARRYFVRRNGSYYDSKPIVGAAVGYEHPEIGPMAHTEFSGGEHGAKAKLEELGFDVVARPSLAAADTLPLREALETALSAQQERSPGEWSDDLQKAIAVTLPNAIRAIVGQDFRVKGSAGFGNQAEIPWVSVFPPGVTGASEGRYVVYLFSSDGSRVFLSLSQAVTGQPKGTLVELAQSLRDAAGEQPDLLTQIDLGGEGDLGERYALATAYALEYTAASLPPAEQLESDLSRFLKILDSVRLEDADHTPSASDDVHLVVKWAARYGADSDVRHVEVAREHGAAWWGLRAAPNSDFRVSEQHINQLHAQIEAGGDTFVFLVGPNCWQTRLLDVQYDREEVDPDLVPGYYESDSHYHLWVKLTDFEPIERDELYRILDPAAKPGRAVALGNQTNPLIVRFRASPRVWWVNQGASFARARKGGYLWAPLHDKAGNTPEHWRSLRHVRPGDAVLNYANTQIRGRSEVLANAAEVSRPDPDADQAWEEEGLRLEVAYHDLSEAVVLEDIPTEWRRAEGGPFTRDGAVKQGYLFPVSDDFAAKLQRTFPQLDLLLTPGVGTVIDTVRPKGRFDLEALEAAVAARRLRIAPEVLANVLAALLGGKHVILTGPPGTAKTTLAELVASVAADAGRCTGYTLTTATADWTTYETIGGLKPDPEAGLAFQEGHFLEAIRRRQWLVIDELNRSNFDRAFGQLFTVLSGQAVELPYERVKGGGRLALVPEGATHKLQSVEVLTIPADWRVIATMNVFDKSLLFEMSFALMRRFAFIEVPSPSQDDFLSLIADQTQGDVEASDLAASFLPVRDLKDLGPAIFMDLARFIYVRKQIGDPNDGQLAFEAFYSYLLPQFEGIDEVAGERLYKLVRKLVRAPNDERLQSTLRAVLGLELATVAPSSPTIEEELDEFPEPSDLNVDEHDPG